jgi:DNA invertase Pin-like site-specific DNA recombinase
VNGIPKPRAYSYLRMSTDMQLKGDSRRRQLDLSAKYANDHGLELVAESQLEDIGVSAFTGANVRDGALGRFLEAASAGNIERGSYLLVESLDRISRQNVRASLSIFLSIIDAGINIVTLADGRVYTPENTEELELISSLVIMARAHDESRTKSQRIRAVWANKRENARNRPLTAMCPAWLRLSADRTRYEVIEDRAAIVRSIFNDTVSGIGNYKITRRLNTLGIPHFGKSAGWHNSYVSKILNNRAVIGEFQPHKVVNGKRQPDGDPIKNYFPAVIDEHLFYQAQACKSDRMQRGRGRKGAYVTNLFSGLATCAYCHSSMKFENKGLPPKGKTYLVCESARRGRGCTTTGWRYDDFEASFLAFIQELDLETILNGGTDDKEQEIEAKIQALQGKLAGLNQQREQTYALLGKTALDFVANKLNECEQEILKVQADLQRQESERARAALERQVARESKEQIQAQIARLRDRNDKDLYKLRALVAERLRSLVVSLTIAPIGQMPATERALAFISAEQPSSPEENASRKRLIEHLESAKATDSRRWFGVLLKDGTTRIVIPNDSDPLKHEVLLHATPGNIEQERLGSPSQSVFLPSWFHST